MYFYLISVYLVKFHKFNVIEMYNSYIFYLDNWILI